MGQLEASQKKLKSISSVIFEILSYKQNSLILYIIEYRIDIMSVCVGVQLKISLTARPIWFSFTVKILKILSKGYNFMREGTSTFQKEITSEKFKIFQTNLK